MPAVLGLILTQIADQGRWLLEVMRQIMNMYYFIMEIIPQQSNRKSSRIFRILPSKSVDFLTNGKYTKRRAI